MGAARLSRGAVAFVSVSAAVAACSLLNPLDGYTGGEVDAAQPTEDRASPPPPVPEAGTDAEVACIPHVPPARPAPGDTTTKLSMTFAGATLELGGDKDGYDLDGRCTCPGTGSCSPRSQSVATPCDGQGGVDNVLGPETQAALAVLPREEGAKPTSGTDYIRRGRNTFFIELRGYNGAANDDDVQVGLYASGGLEGLPPSGVDAGPDSGPKFDGNDVWTVDRDSVIGQGPFQARIEDNRAYVRDGVLVAMLDLDLSVGLFRAKAKECIFTAKIVKNGETFRLDDGTVAGRLRSSDLLVAFEKMRSPLSTSNAYLCRDDLVYLEAKRRVCAALDVATSRADDGKGVKCGAISLALKFSAVPAKTGTLVSVPAERPCGSDWVDDCP